MSGIVQLIKRAKLHPVVGSTPELKMLSFKAMKDIEEGMP